MALLLRLLRSWLALLVALACTAQAASDHTNNWAVLVCSSRFWFNYRHMANTLGMYRTVKRLGIPDSQIILMLADDVACSPRNAFPATVFANADRELDLYGDNIEVDYRGYEVSVESFMRLLTGRQPASTPRSQRLLSDADSNVFVYMTGHGGDEFLKFQDNEEISAFDVADAVEQMYEKRRYKSMLLMFDTCEAQTMYSKVYSPNVLATASSRLDEKSYSHHGDPDIGVHVIDKYTHHLLEYLEGVNKTSTATFADLFSTLTFEKISSHHGVRTDLFPHDLADVLLTDFFGGVAAVDVDDAAAAAAPAADDVDVPEADEQPFRRPVVREGLAIGQARKEEEEGRREAAARAKAGLWVGWEDAGGAAPAPEGGRPTEGRLARAVWAAAGVALLGVAGWAGIKV